MNNTLLLDRRIVAGDVGAPSEPARVLASPTIDVWDTHTRTFVPSKPAGGAQTEGTFLEDGTLREGIEVVRLQQPWILVYVHEALVLDSRRDGRSCSSAFVSPT